MSMKPVLAIVAVGVVVGGTLLVVDIVAKQDAAAEAPYTPPPPPPDDADYLTIDESARYILGEIAGKRGQAKVAAEAVYLDRWIPDSGWEFVVEQVTKENGGTAIRMYENSSTLIGGGFWIIAVCQSVPEEILRYDTAKFQGRIDAVDVLTGDATPTYRIVVRDCRVLRVIHRNR